MQPYQTRLVTEKRELDEKIARLKEFIFGEGRLLPGDTDERFFRGGAQTSAVSRQEFVRDTDQPSYDDVVRDAPSRRLADRVAVARPGSKLFTDLDPEERTRLQDQYIVMKQYSEILGKRIAAGNNLDGKSEIAPVPFDAHEQLVRGTHIPTHADSPDPDPDNIQEYPKAVDHVPHPSGVGLQPVVVHSPEGEQAYHEAKERESADVDAKKAEAARVETQKAETKAKKAAEREAKTAEVRRVE